MHIHIRIHTYTRNRCIVFSICFYDRCFLPLALFLVLLFFSCLSSLYIEFRMVPPVGLSVKPLWWATLQSKSALWRTYWLFDVWKGGWFLFAGFFPLCGGRTLLPVILHTYVVFSSEYSFQTLSLAIKGKKQPGGHALWHGLAECLIRQKFSCYPWFRLPVKFCHVCAAFWRRESPKDRTQLLGGICRRSRNLN